MFSITMSLHSSPVSGILRRAPGVFDHIHNENEGSHSPSGSPIEVGLLLLFEDETDFFFFYSRLQEKFKVIVPLPNWGPGHIKSSSIPWVKAILPGIPP